MSVANNIVSLLKNIPESCTLVAVSKTKPNEAISEAYSVGQRDFGENKVQDLAAKAETLPKDIRWHMIGHLQRNKVKYIAPFVHLIHGVDSLRLLQEIEKQGARFDRQISCLLQIHIAKEETKFGLDESELEQLINDPEVAEMKHIKILGLMGMATYTENESVVKSEFQGLKSLFDNLASSPLPSNMEMRHLSMGMSGDYELAITCGSNMVRVGSLIFGERNYTAQ